jgi:hypothetical protein
MPVAKADGGVLSLNQIEYTANMKALWIANSISLNAT